MDLDIVSQIRVETLRNAVDSVIDGRAMLASLMPVGVTNISATKPKQTGTTQRWKVSLQIGSDEPLHTKIEFSRRRDRISYSTGVPDSQLLKQYKMTPFAAQHYDAASMAAQKAISLASPARVALRDLFDLHHLFFTIGAKPEEVSPLVEPKTFEEAAEKVMRFTFEQFQEQVVPYLTAELVALYGDSTLFEKQKDEVAKVLIGMMK